MTTLFKLAGLCGIAAAIIYLLFLFSYRPLLQTQGFERKFPPSRQPELLDEIRLPTQKGRIAGVQGQRLVVYTSKGRTIWKLDLSSTRTGASEHALAGAAAFVYPHSLILRPEGLYQFAHKDSLVRVFDLAGNALPFLFRNNRYLGMVPLDAETIAVRGVDTKDSIVFLAKVGRDGRVLAMVEDVFPGSLLAVIQCDGQLRYDQSTNRILFPFFYGNGFLCLDNELQTIYRGRTIDTVTVNTSQAVRRGGAITVGGPPRVVNGISAVAGGRLYINSQLRAENESERDFLNHFVIDVYDILTGHYLLSHHVPPLAGKKPTDFAVQGDSLFTIAGGHVGIFRLP